MIKQQTIFQADLFVKSNVGSAEQRNALLTRLATEQTTAMHNSNPGCYRFDYVWNDLDWLLEEINLLLVDAVGFYSEKDKTFSKIPKKNTANIKIWANINAVGSRNTFHTHKDDEFSGVYYVQSNNTGDLRFTNPANVLGDCSRTSPFTRDFSFVPQDGDLILWPSWMPHEVEPNLSQQSRINLAFNIRIAS
jgi:uncharacterized protein (TIGR02466 family)